MDVATLHRWGTHNRAEIKSCRVAGQVRVQVRDYQQHTLCVEPYVIHHYLDSLSFLLPCGGLWRWGCAPNGSLEGIGGCHFWREVLEGWWARGPALLAHFSSEPNTHSRDEGGALATPIFGQEEGHITLW